ncbi:Asp-tRNA(Asn)/Glu-tRNA(Gln) amidotransferase subunit GatA [Candidatus Micrarchaeota archaeon]|nr:Asp-tRNA(Asn)/Glu-tRNA(Gln) amidotransferase subunit GatA [Candidatus Micrarchaeota archaeon]
MFIEKIEKTLERIRRDDPKIGAFIEVYEAEAKERAKKLDERLRAGRKLGKLGGKIFSIKNNIAIKGKKMTCGSKMLEQYVAPYSATVVERIEAEDGIIIGSTNLDEFACGSDNTKSAFFKTLNPLDHEYVPGGSSGGSAASVAADFAEISLGSDTGGSIRAPASFCGVCSIKPTYGLVSRYGLGDLAMSFDQIGPIAKNTADLQSTLGVITGRDEKDQTTTVEKDWQKDEIGDKKIKIAVAEEFLEGLDPKIADLFEELRQKLTEAGHRIDKVSIPSLKYAIPIYYLAVFAEFSSAMQKYDGLRYGNVGEVEELVESVAKIRGEKFTSEVKRRIMLGTFITTKEYQDAWYGKTLKARAKLRSDINSVLSLYDVLLGPTMSSLPWKIGQKNENPLEMYLADILTVPANLAGIPAGSVPYGKIGKFRPGFQIQAARFKDQKVLKLMRTIEELDSK